MVHMTSGNAFYVEITLCTLKLLTRLLFFTSQNTLALYFIAVDRMKLKADTLQHKLLELLTASGKIWKTNRGDMMVVSMVHAFNFEVFCI